MDISSYSLSDYEDVGDYIRKVTTTSSESQEWINRAFLQLYNFNHVEAENCFRKALEYDKNIPMAYWGIAYSVGPHYNLMFCPEESSKNANLNLEKASELLQTVKVDDWEADLIRATLGRYANSYFIGESEDLNAKFRENLKTFSLEMEKVYLKHSENLDVVSIYAESIMNLRPWDLWKKNGEPYEEAVKAREVLEKALKSQFHPQIAHLYIHVVELSPFMKEALTVADDLFNKTKGLGHLMHMPSHIYIQVGQYKKSIEANLRGIHADTLASKRIKEYNFYTFYRAHNIHFLIWTAMFMGDYETYLEYSQLIKTVANEDVINKDPENIEFFYHAYLMTYVRFGKWELILNDPIETRKNFEVTTAMQKFARCIAFSVLEKIKEAESELEDLIELSKKMPSTRRVGNNPATVILDVALEMATGELLYRKGDFDKAFDHLRRSVKLSDDLIYDEPWDWIQPPRHALAALLLEQNHFKESEEVYLMDLSMYPENIWSLTGLKECYEKSGQSDLAKSLNERLNIAQQNSSAKGEIYASCYCKRKKI